MKFFILFIWLTVCVLPLYAQKFDVITKVNGQEMKGKITEISDNEVRFIYDGETTEYILKKGDIAKILHSSGRIEEFAPNETGNPVGPGIISGNKTASNADTNEDAQNKVAILPFEFIMENTAGGVEMATKVQGEAFEYLSNRMPGYTLLDPRTTNSLLRKASITFENMKDYTVPELCNILGVEYIIEGTVNQHTGAQTNFSSGSYQVKDKDTKGSRKGTDNTYSISQQNYQTTVGINVMNNRNEQIYHQNHRALLPSDNADYTTPLQYVLKRIPFYKKQ